MTEQAILTEPVVCSDLFVSPEICRQILRELRFTLWRPSGVSYRGRDGSIGTRRSMGRRSETSTQQWFSQQLRAHVDSLETRIERSFGISPERCEAWQATRYGPGGRYDFHLDAGYHEREPAGERAVSFLLFLDTPQAGGATRFRDLDLEFAAEAGRLLSWRNLLSDGSIDRRMYHAALPVTEGHKTVLVTWARERKLRNAIQTKEIHDYG
jgi:prolyl 4-hydroxylase